jgi:hypothetical protein
MRRALEVRRRREEEGVGLSRTMDNNRDRERNP